MVLGREMDIENLPLIEEMYRKFKSDPSSVDPSWRYFFEGVEFGSLSKEKGLDESAVRIYILIRRYRRFGHLKAKTNPLAESTNTEEFDVEKLGFSKEELGREFPTLGFCGKDRASLQEIINALEAIYADRIGFEFIDLGRRDLEEWVQKRVEPVLSLETGEQERQLILDTLNRSEVLESFIHTKYVGQKRFSLEGCETLIPVLAELLQEGSRVGVEDVAIGMAHRGRLNVLTNILGKPYSLIFQEFEDIAIPLSFEGSGDVKYHKGMSSLWTSRSGQSIRLTLAANPSHLEAVDPVILGQTRAIGDLSGDKERKKTVPILIHGDAALAGQGVIYEILQMQKLPGYTVGGTLHIVINNQIGFTTLPEEGRSTRYSTDIAKAFGCPVFHVNAEDPESCLFAAKLALSIRQEFGIDVFIDLIGYRKYGHNEGDEPFFTQPLEYKKIRGRSSIRERYIQTLQDRSLASQAETAFRELLSKAHEEAKKASPASQVPSEAFDPFAVLETAVSLEKLRSVGHTLLTVPPGFNLHPKLGAWLKEREKMLEGRVDWSFAEALSFGTLLSDFIPIRFTGQDVKRGTFSHRHDVWIDQEQAQPYSPFSLFQSPFELYNSPLSEYAVLGYEYGYSWAHPKALVLWEAQFGDFFNGAEIIIDQFIASAETKWTRRSNLTLLLPHGLEGMGPEHSSGRIERFLQLAAQDNMTIAYPTTPAQYFHLLRRQALRTFKKPCIIFTPKSLLRSPQNTSLIQDLSLSHFQTIIDDPIPAEKILICSGKVYYDLLNEREKRGAKVAIVRIEQLYPLDEEKLKKILDRNLPLTYVQEEAAGQGAWDFLRPFLPHARFVSRPRSASPATGSHKQHLQELSTLLDEAFRS
jgi:2-oxoglutarate dehydrogenase E1 component